MSEPFLAEIKIVSFGYNISGWAMCNGQLLPINQNQALFSLLGTTYGGNGQTNFALPNFRGRIPMHSGNGHDRGEAAGSDSVTISQSQMPQHTHIVSGVSEDGDNNDPTGRRFAKAGSNLYIDGSQGGLVAMHPGAVSNVGGSQPHNNTAPVLTVNFLIALQGIFPSPS